MPESESMVPAKPGSAATRVDNVTKQFGGSVANRNVTQFTHDEGVWKFSTPLENLNFDFPVCETQSDAASSEYSALSKMSHDEIKSDLANASSKLWDVKEDEEFGKLLRQVLELEATIQALRRFRATQRSISNGEEIPANRAEKLSRFIDAPFKDKKHPERGAKVLRLPLDYSIFIGLSYSVTEMTKLSDCHFDGVIRTIPIFIERAGLGLHWARHRQISKAVGGCANNDFKNGWSP